ncbi:MMPL family transporter [Arthrobacter castelli]|uniref:MMPL family transporter n=1 Tax=Arthrobacter castelli TaxID=271431 RepID=UPI0003F803E0|nr:MMPL family transporter [Arthrobacter castelli]
MHAQSTISNETSHDMSRMERLAAWSQKHHWLALVAWVAVLLSVTGVSTVIGADYENDYAIPGTESQQLRQTLEEHGAEQANDSVRIVMEAEDGIASAESRISSMLDDVESLPHVADVTAPTPNRGSVSDEGTIGFATVTLDGQAAAVPGDAVRSIIDTAQSAQGQGLQVALGGDAVAAAQESSGGAAEGAGMLAALVILVFMFGSLLAATLPLITAVFAVGSTLGLVMLASHIFSIPDYTAPVLILVGIGVGIDYALIIFSRYRSELLAGADRRQATRTALNTAGRSVLFAGATVVIALLGLLLLGLSSLQGMALAVTLTVLMTMLAAIILLPSLLTIFGQRLERSIHKHAARSKREHGAGWRRWAEVVQRNPWPALLAATAALVALSIPALGMHLGFADAGTHAKDTTTRQAYETMAEGFGPGFNGPLVVLTEGDAQAAAEARDTLASTAGVAEVTPPQPLEDDGYYTLLAFPETAPQSEETARLVTELRTDVLPEVAEGTGADYLVGGTTAAAIDFSSAVSERMPAFIASVVGLSALLLMLVFRSILIPLKAAVLNLLSIGASLGVITLVFQYGWFGVPPGPIEAFVPVMIFAIVFGLSMDYEVFLVSRMHEKWRRTGSATRAIREGLAATGGVITAAAAIMIVVFGAFVLFPDRMLQQFGLGLATAVLLDAVVIRCLIVPAAMRLFGHRAWWLPGWLDRRLPQVALEDKQ